MLLYDRPSTRLSLSKSAHVPCSSLTTGVRRVNRTKPLIFHMSLPNLKFKSPNKNDLILILGALHNHLDILRKKTRTFL